jgi:hypothetical protein
MIPYQYNHYNSTSSGNVILKEDQHMKDNTEKETDSGHEWFAVEDFSKAIRDLKASRVRVKELEAAMKERSVWERRYLEIHPVILKMNGWANFRHHCLNVLMQEL